MTRSGLPATILAVALASGLSTGCGVKAPPRPPLKESPASDAGASAVPDAGTNPAPAETPPPDAGAPASDVGTRPTTP